MANRGLSRKALALAVGRAESSINRLAGGMTAPTAAVLQDIAPVLQVPLADLLVIAGLPTGWPQAAGGFGDRAPAAGGIGERAAAVAGIGELVAAAGGLSDEQLRQVTALARQLRTADPG